MWRGFPDLLRPVLWAFSMLAWYPSMSYRMFWSFSTQSSSGSSSTFRNRKLKSFEYLSSWIHRSLYSFSLIWSSSTESLFVDRRSSISSILSLFSNTEPFSFSYFKLSDSNRLFKSPRDSLFLATFVFRSVTSLNKFACVFLISSILTLIFPSDSLTKASKSSSICFLPDFFARSHNVWVEI